MFQDRLTQERYIIQKRPTKKTFKLYLMDRTWGTAYVCMHEDVLIYIRHIRLHIHEIVFMYMSYGDKGQTYTWRRLDVFCATYLSLYIYIYIWRHIHKEDIYIVRYIYVWHTYIYRAMYMSSYIYLKTPIHTYMYVIHICIVLCICLYTYLKTYT